MAEDNVHRILMVCTSTSTSSWGTLTGLWLEELATPYYEFKEKGYTVDICSIEGIIAIEPVSLRFKPDSVRRFEEDIEAQEKWQKSKSVSFYSSNRDILSKYGCIFLCGGHGCIDDFPSSSSLRECVEHVYGSGGCVAAICHGSLGLVNCVYGSQPLLRGKFVAAFSNEEELALGLSSVLPLLTETAVDLAGAICVPCVPWKPNAVVDGRLVTAQNPQSSLQCAQRALDVLRSLGPIYSPVENANRPWGA